MFGGEKHNLSLKASLLPFLEEKKSRNVSMFDEHIGYFCIRSVVCLWKFACPLMGAGKKEIRREKLGQKLRISEVDSCRNNVER